jgi:type II secretory pathway pseudopilin PulG
MNHRPGSAAARGRSATRAFTLLELCLVLLIIAILAGTMMPAVHSAFIESAMRTDARQLSLLVKTAMLQSDTEHRNYIIDLTASSIDLHPVAVETKGDSSAATPAEDDSASGEGATFYRLDPADRFSIPDPKRNSAWISLPATSWLFQPGALCAASRVRLVRGPAWLEMNFNALTGNVESESSYFP